MIHNPYQQPNSDLTQADDINQLPLKFGVDWLFVALRLFVKHPFMWVILTAVFFIIALLLFVTKYLIPLLLWDIFIYVTGVCYLGYQSYRNHDYEVSDWLVAVSDNLAQIVILPFIAIMLMAILVAILPALVMLVIFIYNKISANDIFVNFWFNIPPNTPLIYVFIVGILVAWLFFQPIIMAVFFTPLLILIDGKRPLSALKMSFGAYKANFLPLTLYGLLFILLLAINLFLLKFFGLFILIFLMLLPIGFLGMVGAYCQIFNKTI